MKYSYDRIKFLTGKLREIPLTHVMARAGAVRDRYDKNKWHTSEGTISVTGQRFMNWNLNKGGGGAIDLVIHLYRFDFKAAIVWLEKNSRYSIDNQPPLDPPGKPAIFMPPLKCDQNLPSVINYLTFHRKIPQTLLYRLIDSGKLYADIKSNAVFLLLGKEKKVVGAELRGTSQKRWMGMSKGSRKDLGAFSVKALAPRNIVICESAIDAISYHALHPDCTAVSTSGATPAPAWLTSLVNRDVEIYCGFDKDKTGNANANEMIHLFPKVKRLKPPKHDWNEVLKSISYPT
jgi:hypothetical protein